MKTLFILCFAVFAASLHAADWTTDYAALLKRYVTADGVRYAEWKRNAHDMAAMQRVVDGIAGASASSMKGKDQLAFYINAYNAWILHTALDKYPTKTLKFVFFLPGKIKVAGEKMSFDNLEKNVIRKRFAEPRVHFALNCASRSCPPLLDEPFRSKDLDVQLDKLAKAFVNSDRGVRVAKSGVELSKIFDWYRDDFGGTPKAIDFINARRSQPIPKDAAITYQEYNWNLNEAK